MTMHLSPDLLTAERLDERLDPEFRATMEAHGLYNTQQFVLRLSPAIHRKLSEFSPGITTNGVIGFDGAQAMSTLLHETVHWWQHIGSTFGFVLSLNYPVQSHCTHFDLKRLVDEDGFKKSVFLQSIELNKRGPSGYGTLAGRANTIINNHYDLLAFRAFTLGPEQAKKIVQQALFQAVGHAFHMTYAHTVNILASSVDPEFKAMPHPKEWADGFDDLKNRKVEGYYYRSPVGVWPIGAQEIFEGQARFSQIQFLSHACGHRLEWADFHAMGMLNGVYVRAFETFLQLTSSAWPTHINDPLVGLFLLVCDLSINPGRGFPFSVAPNFESFIYDVHPGARFCIFSQLIARRFPAMKRAVRLHTRDEYESIAEELCEAAKEPSPLLIAKVFMNWFSDAGPLSGLREEYVSYAFKPGNYVIRHLYAHFLALQEDRFRSPEFFCWPGAWAAGDNVTERFAAIFEKHGALFVDKEDDDAVFPRIQASRDESAVYAAFNEFYHNTVIYELTNQWIASPGPFRYDIGWLTSATKETAQDYLCRQFSATFGLNPETVIVLS